MNKHIVFAYGIAGLAVAVGAVMMIGSSYSLLGPGAKEGPDAAEQASTQVGSEAGPRGVGGEAAAGAQGPQLALGEFAYAPLNEPTQVDSAEQPVEIVYVDEPAPRRGHGDDDDDDDDDDRAEQHKSRKHKHDKHKRRGEREGHDDDDD